MKLRETQKTKSISYGGFFAHAFLWQKAFLLVPLWGIAIIPVVGFVCRGFGNLGMQLGFGLMLCLSAVYFLEDLLKRKITVDDEYIFFGFRAIPIKSITSVDVTYKKGRFLPSQLLLSCDSGQRLKLNLGGLSDEGVDILVKYLQSKNSTLKTAPVLNTLLKCRVTKRKTMDRGEKLELPYQSRRFITESIDVFKSTAAKWARIGPVATCMLVGPLWMGWLMNLYTSLQPRVLTQTSSPKLGTFLSQCFDSCLAQLYKSIGHASEQIGYFAVNPLVAFITGASIVSFLLYLLRLFWRPNCLIADQSGMRLVLRLGELALPLGKVAWANIQNASLVKTGSHSGKLQFEQRSGKKFRLDLSAIAVEDRSLLLKRIEKLIPTNQIDYELSQALLAKSERSYTEIWLQSLNQSPQRRTLEPLQPGQLVGDNHFEVLKSIGVGGQGKAYLCRYVETYDSAPDTETVVLKETIMPIFADGTVRRKALEGFEKEASLLKSLDDKGVVKLVDYFVEDHRAYLVLEHIDGLNLRELVLRDGPLTEEQVRDLALQMCRILQTLHEKSIVHRDFTPDNLILNSKGQLKLIDFNVAQQIQEGSSGTIVGKHAYLPPEQFRGKASAQSDLYACGATLYFLLTGTDPEPISQSSPQSRNTQVSESLDRIVKQSTMLQTNKRYQSAKEIETALLSSMDSAAGALSQAETSGPGNPEVVFLSSKAKTEAEVPAHG